MAGKLKSGEIRPLCTMGNEFNTDILVLKYSPNREHIVAGCSDGILRIFKSGTGQLIRSLENTEKTENVAITSLKFRLQENNSENRLLCSYTNGHIILWNYETGNIIKHIREERQTLGVTYHPKLPKFLSNGNTGAIYLYDEETMKVENKYEKGISFDKSEGHTSRVFTTIFHPQQVNEFLSGGWDNIVHFWDLRQKNSVRFIRGPHICGEGIDFSKTGREILTCAYQKENAIQLWHYKSGKLVSNLEPDLNKTMLYCGCWLTPDYIITGGTDPVSLRIVTLKSLTTVATFKGQAFGVYSIDYYIKRTRRLSIKKDAQSQGEIRFAFSVDKGIVESEINL